MRVIKRLIKHKSRSDVFRIIPLGDIHIGAAACNEKLFRRVVKGIAEDDNAYWIGMGDYCDFINRRDPRFDVNSLADFLISKEGLSDITEHQRDRYLNIIEPIAHKCLAMVEGNHETAITRHTERAIFGEIVTAVKQMGGFDEEYELGLGYYGWLRLQFQRRSSSGKPIFVFNLHHGFVGGKLAGAKALNMQRWLWTHDCDVTIFGHSHNTMTQIEKVEGIDKNGVPNVSVRRGCYGGSFLEGSGEGHTTYSEMKGYFPLPLDGVEILLRPGAADRTKALRILS